MGAEELNLSIRTSINISGLSNICASISPTSPSPKPLAVSVKSRPHKQHIWFFADTKANAKKTKRAVSCKRSKTK
jgi:hypothetical protein